MVKSTKEWIKKYESDQLLLATGMRKTGKTQIVKQIIRERLIPANIEFEIYDPNAEYVEYPNNRYIPQTDTEEEFEEVATRIWNKGNLVFAIDEAEQFMSVKRPLTAHMMLITRRGRHKGIGAAATTRRIAELNKEYFSLSDWILLFKMFSPNDIKYVSEFLGKDYAESLRTLPPYNYLVYHEGNVEQYQPDTPWWQFWKKTLETEKWYNVPEETIEFGTLLQTTGILKLNEDIDFFLDNPLAYDDLYEKYEDYMEPKELLIKRWERHHIESYGGL